ncbi:MAG TPA: multidrug effflux MFS transporter [Mycobacteriales bacterium]|nr:multidrug effflux MFS transporter [Mycobacteriales bacterium]
MRGARGTILLLGTLAAIGPLSGDTYLPAFPQIAADLGAPPVRVQLTLTASLLGLAVGQLVIGPVSDLWGRRRLLLGGTALYAVVSLGCALAPTIGALTGLRFLQGFAGAAGVVLARAVVRDLYSGAAAARAFSRLLLVFAVAPIVAPLLGTAVLAAGDWRTIFLLLAAVGVLQFLAVRAWLGETLPPARRTAGGLRRIPGVVRDVVRDRSFLGYALACGFAFAGMFAYIAGSPFVVQDLHGASPGVFAGLFAVNAAGLAVATAVNARLVARVEPRRLLSVGLAVHAAGGVSLLGAVLLDGRLVTLVPPMFVVVASLGFVLPNATALALARFPASAGTASSILGALHFAIGASVAPLVGVGGPGTAVPFGAVIAGTGVVAVAVLSTVHRTKSSPGGAGP